MNKWQQAQKWEKEWWNACQNTYYEEMKQLLYAEKMGLVRVPDAKTPYRFDLREISVLDIGGGPVSLLLKCVNVRGKVVDPLPLPKWVKERYKLVGIECEQIKAENIKEKGFDEVWIYNVLQHAENPQKIIQNARRAGKIIRIFEWMNTPPSEGHPHTLTEKELNEWLNGEGKVKVMGSPFRGNCKAYYGIFPTK